MAIDRYKLVSRHDPVLEKIDVASPLTVGNGELAFTADVTGLQTLYDIYAQVLPLCTMSQWGWHSTPVSAERERYTLEDLVMTEFEHNGKILRYPKNPQPGNEEVYEWLRKNPHRLNLARIGLEYQGAPPAPEQIEGIHQRLTLYSGTLESQFELAGVPCQVTTVCDSESDTLGVRVCSELLAQEDLTVAFTFPYGSPDTSASDFTCPERHRTEEAGRAPGRLLLKRTLDQDTYYVDIVSQENTDILQQGHRVVLKTRGSSLEFSVRFLENSPESGKSLPSPSMEIAERRSRNYWREFWEKGGIVQLHNSPDPRAEELERRIILSMYLLAINSCGSAPPQETGLTCNSWYGKMHLEMYLLHCAWAPLWGHTELLERSLDWYVQHIPEARENAARNQYRGSRWPKMVAGEGIDSPSKVAPMLIWQQPHIIFMLELAWRERQDRAFLEKYWILVKETADFMTDLAEYDEETGVYHLEAPVIPVQECHRPEKTRNPAFEVVYWKYTLEAAVAWAKRLGISYDKKWEEVAGKMAGLDRMVQDGLYLAHEKCPTTFTVENHDHPSMLMAYGLLPNEKADTRIMSATLDKVLECWNYPSLWGWDFAVMAMTAARLGRPETAVDILLKDTPKNEYVSSGNNRQSQRKDLPLYLPGNGSLMLAVSLMAAGYEGGGTDHPGFPADWVVETERLQKYV